MPLVVITGGARSGKSTAAQLLATERLAAGDAVVVAVFGDAGVDAEMADRIAAHQASRPGEFRTVEARDGHTWKSDVSTDALLLLDCLGTLLGRVMTDVLDARVRKADGSDEGGLAQEDVDEVTRRFDAELEWLVARNGPTIVVTNEVGDGVVPVHASGRLFRDLLGRANRRLVGSADAAYLAVCGRLVDLAALPSFARWPED